MHIQVQELLLTILPDNQHPQYGVDVMAITQNIFQDIKQPDFLKCIQVYHTSGTHHVPRKSPLSVC